MLAAGILTRVVPAGAFERTVEEGRTVIVPDSFRPIQRPAYPPWRWLTAPFEVVAGPDGLVVIVIILFLILIGGAFAVLDRCGLLQAALARIVRALGGRKYALLGALALFFMALGAFFGIVEEVVPLVPLVVGLCYALGWDSLTGLAITFGATNLGFAAAVTNPFTIGVAQRIAGLPLFSGAGLRLAIFAALYAAFALFLLRYARRIEHEPARSPVYAEDQPARARYATLETGGLAHDDPRLDRALALLAAGFVLILAVLLGGPFVPALSELSLPLVGVLFFLTGIGAGLVAGGGRVLPRALGEGIAGIAPAVPLILMAASVKHIIMQGGVMDTLLHTASLAVAGSSPLVAALGVFGVALLLDFFIGSGSAKAFLLMPILTPLADLVGLTRQTTVLAYCFGEGLTNLIYPTNAVLLVALGLTVVGYPKWLRWIAGLWPWAVLLALAGLALAVGVGFGPF